MILKWKSVDMNIEFGIIYLCEFSSSSGKKKIGRQYGLTFFDIVYDSKEEGEIWCNMVQADPKQINIVPFVSEYMLMKFISQSHIVTNVMS